jgi:hypothetical protein
MENVHNGASFGPGESAAFLDESQDAHGVFLRWAEHLVKGD